MSKPQVVIIRKDKRIRHKLLHATVFALTGGVSGIATAAEAANHASYNARTRRLQAEAEGQPGASQTAKGSDTRRAAGSTATVSTAGGIPRRPSGSARPAAPLTGEDEQERPVTTGQ